MAKRTKKLITLLQQMKITHIRYEIDGFVHEISVNNMGSNSLIEPCNNPGATRFKDGEQQCCRLVNPNDAYWVNCDA